jgi:HlyD family secretion protein
MEVRNPLIGQSTSSNVQGSMDRVRKKKFWNTQRIAIFGGGGALLAFIVYQLFFADKRSKLNVEAEETDSICCYNRFF